MNLPTKHTLDKIKDLGRAYPREKFFNEAAQETMKKAVRKIIILKQVPKQK